MFLIRVLTPKSGFRAFNFSTQWIYTRDISKKEKEKKKNFYDSEVQKTPKSEEASKLVATPIIN